MTKQQALARVESLSSKIDGAELSLNEWKWARAEAMAAASEAGATQREIGKAAGLVQQTVARHLQVVTRYPRTAKRPPYTEAYDKVTGFDRDAAQTRTDTARTTRVLRDAPMEQIEHIVAKLPADRQRQLAAAAGSAYHQKLTEVAEKTEGDFDRATDLKLPPHLHKETRKLVKKLAEIKQYLAKHANKTVRDPDGGPDERLGDIILDGLIADKGEIDNAFSELGVGTSIEEGFSTLLSES